MRPVVILTRPEVIDIRELVTVAEVTTSVRGLATEVEIDHVTVGLEKPSVINCDGLHTIPQTSLTRRVGHINDQAINRVCTAVAYALAC
ncbi:MAG TPA: type II toxin-antitoxin system PemK/MazF family toxin [Acidimicrobiia bacterium]|nr:type II toxin-antitoxin system PemK/MazF family toxin [Acidimicrobiia bacterium]